MALKKTTQITDPFADEAEEQPAAAAPVQKEPAQETAAAPVQQKVAAPAQAAAKPAEDDTPWDEMDDEMMGGNRDMADIVSAPVEEQPPQQAETQVAAAPVVGEVMPEEATQEVAVAQQAKEVSTVVSGYEYYADQGMAGLEMTFGSYMIISLPNTGQFKDQDKNFIGTEFECVIQGSREKWLYKGQPPVANAQALLAFSYDKVTAHNGKLIVDIVQQWKHQGFEVSVKKYIEVKCLYYKENGETEPCVLSIPHTSIGRLTVYIDNKLAFQRRKKWDEVVTKVAVGEIINNVKFPFYPWDFSYVRDI
ncbi:MAG: hypothetical protein KAJ03_03445 [Gammaproteobacteria bacterium]|nr:hypothetical protein [Gammaproteobacteria bacterium]